MSKIRATIIMTALLTFVFLGIAGVILGNLGLISPSIATTITELSNYASPIIAVLCIGVVAGFVTLIIKKANILLALFTSILLVGVILSFTIGIVLHVKTKTGSTVNPTQSPILNASSPTSISPNPTNVPTSSSTEPVWQQLVDESAPTCISYDGASWAVPSQMTAGTNQQCNNTSSVTLQQTTSKYYGDENLDQVNGKDCNPSIFRLQVQVTFPNPTDDKSWAGILIQTPVADGVPGGYVFAFNSQGSWQLQYVASGTSISPEKQSPQDGPMISMNEAQGEVSTNVTIELTQGNFLQVSTDNNPNLLNTAEQHTPPPGLIGLMVEVLNNGSIPSSPIQYSNFQLDVTDSSFS